MLCVRCVAMWVWALDDPLFKSDRFPLCCEFHLCSVGKSSKMDPVCSISDLVVAVFNESLGWLHSVNTRMRNVFLYLKNPARLETVRREFPHAKVFVLQNIGRESHTFAYHLATHYDVLAPRTYFLQGTPWDHVDREVLFTSFESQGDFLELGKQLKCNGNGEPHHVGLPLTQVFQELFGIHRTSFMFVQGAQFAVSSERARKFSKDVYSNVLIKHQHLHTLPWIMERFWLHMFSV